MDEQKKSSNKIRLKDLFRLSGITREKDTGMIDQEFERHKRSTVSITSAEQKAILKKSYVPTDTDDKVELNELTQVINDTATSIYRRKLDNQRIRQLMPEINQASSIVTSSILSPNDLQGNGLTISLNIPEEKMTATQKQKVIEEIERAFYTISDLNTKLGEWLDECLYGVGAKPIIILPEDVLFKMVKKNIHDNIDDYQQAAHENIYDMTEDYNEKNSWYFDKKLSLKTDNVALDNETKTELTHALESIDANGSNKKHPSNKSSFEKYISGVEEEINTLIKSKTLLTIEENPLLLTKENHKTKAVLENISKKITSFTKNDIKTDKEPFIDIHNPDTVDENNIGNPVMIEPPTEVTIPITVPGDNTNHIGYFVMLDSSGNPLTLEENDLDDNLVRDSYEAMFKKSYYNKADFSNISKEKRHESVNKIYENMLNKYITNSLEEVGINNTSIELNNSIKKCMFRRMLSHKETKILFVPKELLIYYRFDHHPDGTGKSKIDDIKFLVSARLSLIVSRILGTVERAIPRQKIKVSFGDKATNILSTLKKIKNGAIEKRLYDFSYDPTSIVKSIVSRSVGVEHSGGLPGVENYSVENEATTKESGGDDVSDLSEELKNMTGSSLGPPAASLNSLSDSEYSRSVATTNLLFSKLVSMWQKITCKYTKDLLITYCQFSGIVRNSITEILKENENESINVDDVIAAIDVSLPSPNMAPNKAHYEELDDIMSTIDTLAENMYNEELMGPDRDSSEYINMFKALAKRDAVKEYSQKVGLTSFINLDNLEEIDQMPLQNIQQYIINMKKFFEEMKEKLSGDDGGSRY